MNAEQLRAAAHKKREVEAIAKELGYDSLADAAYDLQQLGVLEGIEVKPPEPESTLGRARALEIQRQAMRRDRLRRLPYLIKVLSREEFTCKEFGFLMKSVGWDHQEKELFKHVMSNIIDLENFRKIPFHYGSMHRDELMQEFAVMYPEMRSAKKEDRSDRIRAVEKEKEKPKQEQKKPPMITKSRGKVWAAVAGVIGFIIGALLL